MSYILDALKKLEHEKARKSRDNGPINISGALFRDERPLVSRGGGGRRMVIIVVVASLATFGTTWFVLSPAGRISALTNIFSARNPQEISSDLLKGGKMRDAVTSRTVSPSVNPPLMPAPAPVTPAVAVPQASAVLPVTPTTVPASPAAAIAREDAAPNATQDEGETPRRKGRKNQRAVPVPARQEQAPAVAASVAPPVDIKVSGIAWQDERPARRAVVNGMLMKEGSTVAGARITEILKDRVRFSLSGSVFELSLLASGMPGTGK